MSLPWREDTHTKGKTRTPKISGYPIQSCARLNMLILFRGESLAFLLLFDLMPPGWILAAPCNCLARSLTLFRGSTFENTKSFFQSRKEANKVLLTPWSNNKTHNSCNFRATLQVSTHFQSAIWSFFDVDFESGLQNDQMLHPE